MEKSSAAKDKILQCLKEAEDYVSGEDLSRELGVSRSAVWKNINSLRENGYPIESVTNRGYRLSAEPDVLNETEVLNGLRTKTIGRSIAAFREIDSTNEEAKRRAQQGAPHGSVFVAERQLGGKGRLGRVWVSPPKTGLWFTILLRPEEAPSQVAGITLLTGLAVCRAIHGATGCGAMIKWPNDIVIGGRKVCGILTEMSAEIDRVHYAVVGIGINVNNEDFPPELSVKATSLRMETGKPVSRVHLLQRILEEFESPYDAYIEKGGPFFLEDYKKRCVTLGRTVGAIRGREQIAGTAVDITPDGELVVRLKNGELLQINSGEVTVQGIYGQ